MPAGAYVFVVLDRELSVPRGQMGVFVAIQDEIARNVFIFKKGLFGRIERRKRYFFQLFQSFVYGLFQFDGFGYCVAFMLRKSHGIQEHHQ